MEKTTPKMTPAMSVEGLMSNLRLKMSITGMSTMAPSVVRSAVKVNASMDSMPIDWATNEEPQITAVRSRRIMPLGVVLRIGGL